MHFLVYLSTQLIVTIVAVLVTVIIARFAAKLGVEIED